MRTKQRAFYAAAISSFVLATMVDVASAVDDVRGLPETLDRVQKAVSSAGVASAGTSCSDCAEAVRNPFIDCIKTICKAPAMGTLYGEMVTAAAETARDELPRDLERVREPVLKWFNRVIETEKEAVERLDKLLAGKSLVPNPKFAPVHNFFMLAGSIRFMVPTFDEATGTIGLDKAQTDENLKALPRQYASWLMEGFTTFLAEPAVQRWLALSGTPAITMLRETYPDLSLSEAVRKEAQAAQALLAELRKATDAYIIPEQDDLGELFDEELAKQIAEGKRTDEASVQKFYDGALGLRAMYPFFIQPEKHPWMWQIKPTDIRPIFEASGAKKRIKELRVYLSDPKRVDELRESVVQGCAADLAFHRATLPTAVELARGPKIAEAAKSGAKQKFFARFSPHSAATLNRALDKAQFIMPLKAEDYQRDFLALLREKAHPSRLAAGKQASDGDPVKREQNSILQGYSLLGPDWELESYLAEKFDDCNAILALHLDDRAALSSGATWMSWGSLRNEKLGKAVTAHEIGHLADQVFSAENVSVKSAESYARIQGCLAQKHPETPVSEGVVSNPNVNSVIRVSTGMYNQEDFADLVSAVSVPETNVACFFGLEMEDGDGAPHLINPEKDPHSSALFRLLHIEMIRKGELPGACQKALKFLGDQRDFSSCL